MKKFKKHLPAPHVTELLVMGGVSAKEQIDSLYSGVSERPVETTFDVNDQWLSVRARTYSELFLIRSTL